MKAYNGFEKKVSGKAYEQLPPGPYVAVIKAVKLEGYEPDQALILRLDIAEGQYEGYYTKRYISDTKRENSKFPAKYKGDFRLRVPNDENTKAMYPESDKKKFNDFVARIEASNPGYEWRWEEDTLKGLMIGVSVRQGTYNGSGYTKIARLETVDDVRNGKVSIMPPMEPRGDAWEPPVDQQSGFTVVNTDEVPF